MFIKSSKHQGPPESKKFEVDIGGGVHSEPKIFADENDPEIVANNDGKPTYDDVSIGERTPEPEESEETIPVEESSESVEPEEHREPYEPKFFENFFPEADTDFVRDQNELRERIAILKSLEEKYKGERYIPITMSELTDTLLIFEELLDLRQMSQDFGRNHDDYLEKLRGTEEEVEDDDGLTGELFEMSNDEENNEDHESHEEFEEGDYEDEENPWNIEEDEDHVEEQEHLEEAWDLEQENEEHHNEHQEEDDEWELGDSDDDHHFNENEHDLFIEHQAEKIAEEHHDEVENDGHNVIADSDALHDLMEKVQHHTEDLQSPNLSELSYDSINIKKNQNHETLNDEILVIEGLEIIFQKMFMNVPDDKEYLNGITSENHDQVEEIFGIVHDYMEEYNNESTHLHEELDFIIKTMSLLPVSDDHILQFFDLFEKYSDIAGKLKEYLLIHSL